MQSVWSPTVLLSVGKLKHNKMTTKGAIGIKIIYLKYSLDLLYSQHGNKVTALDIQFAVA